jgi:hypothetical protein
MLGGQIGQKKGEKYDIAKMSSREDFCCCKETSGNNECPPRMRVFCKKKRV